MATNGMSGAWRDMQPGRNLDRLIALRLGFGVRGPIGAHNELLLTDAGDKTGFTLPRYSTNTDAALRLPLDGFAFELHREDGFDWFCEYYEIGNPSNNFHATADTPAAAICYAWLSYIDKVRL